MHKYMQSLTSTGEKQVLFSSSQTDWREIVPVGVRVKFKKPLQSILPIVVVLMDDRDGARVQVDPEEVGPHLHASLQPVAFLHSGQLTVDSVHSHSTC